MPALTLPVQIETNRILIPGGATSQNIKDAITAAPADSQIIFTGACSVSDWGATPFVLSKRLWFIGDGCGVLTGSTAYTQQLFDVRAPIWVRGMKFDRIGRVFQFLATTGGKLDMVHFDKCEFYDIIRCFYAPDTSGGETIGVKRMVVDGCRFYHTNLTEDDGVTPRASDGEECIDWQAPFDSMEIVNNWGDKIKKAFVRAGFTFDESEVAGWNKFTAAFNTLSNIQAGQVGSVSTNNASAINFFGRDAVIKGNQVDTVQCADADEQTGVFCFCETAIIDGNRLHNCGGRDGTISIKADTRANLTANPPGYRIQITNNSITYTDAYTAAQAAPQRGIWCQQEDVLIQGNIIDRTTHHAIHLIGGYSAYKTTVTDNIVTNCRILDTSDAAVHVNCGSDLLFCDNIVECTPQTGIAGRCVRVQPDNTGARQNWIFRGNVLRNSGGASSSRGFMIVASSDVAPLEFTGNKFYGVQQGIRFDSGVISDVIADDNYFHSDVTTPIVFNTGATPTRYRFRNNPGRLAQNIVFADLDPSPSVASEDGLYVANYSAPVAVGKFDGLVAGDNGECRQDGDIISVWCGESDTFHIQHNNSIRTQKGEDYLTADELAYKIRQFIRKGTQWLEITSATGSAPTNSNRRVPAPVIVMARPLPQGLFTPIASRGKV